MHASAETGAEAPLSRRRQTTRNTITSTVHTLLTQREHWDTACAQPATIPALLEETLRRDAPHRGLMRRVTHDVELGGTKLSEGSLLLLLFGSANRDETRFTDPDEFIPNRSNIRDHLGFGQGTHFCIGAHLARAECRVALEALTARIPDMRLAENYTPQYDPAYFFRGLEKLHTVW